MTVKLLTQHHLEFLTLKGGCTGSSEYTLFKIPHCWKSHVTAQMSGPCNRVFKKCSYFKSAIIFFSIGSTDPFKEQVEDASAGGKDSLIHIRIQQRNGRKTLTTVQGLSSDYDLKKIVKVCKKVMYILYRDFIAILGRGLQGS